MIAEETLKKFVIAAHGDLDQVRQMLETQPDLLNMSYDWGPGGPEDALEAAGHMGNRAIAEYLLGKGAPLTVFAAAMLGRADDVRRFLAEQPQLATTSGVHGFSLLWHAALSGSTEIAQLITECGAPVGSFELHAAASMGHAGMVRWLVDHGATDFTLKNFQDQTPLQAAEALGHSDVAALLRDLAG
jgi:ankyrin repeat protein